MKKILSLATTVALAGLFGLGGAGTPQAAETGRPARVVDYETIFAALNADGSVETVRLVDTLRIHGQGDVTVTDPTSTEDFRVLSGFSEPQLGEGEATYTVEDLRGEEEFVVASTPPQDPPVEMVVTYHLNGEWIEPEDLVGRSGRVQMIFDVTNTTTTTETLIYDDAGGKERTFKEEVPLPMVAQLQMVLPANHFTDIEAEGAEKVTDPRGDITVLWNLVMVPPIGSSTQSPEIVMDAEDFQLGAIRLTAVPVAPKDREFLAFAEEELAGGIESAEGLYDGATELGDGVDELHDGTLELLDGMEQLYQGSLELSAGLQEAHTGSGTLTAGLGEASAGSGELTAGLGDAGAGSERITGGLDDLAGGLKDLLSGLKTLATGVPEAQAGAQQIAVGLQSIDAALATLQAGLGTARTGAQDIAAGAGAISAGAGTIGTGAAGIQSKATGIVGGALQPANTNCGGDPDGFCQTAVRPFIQAAIDCLTGTGASCGGGGSIAAIAGQIQAGAGTIQTGANQIQAGAGAIVAGLTSAINGIGSPSAGGTIRAGVAQLRAGAVKLAGGLTEAISGLGTEGNTKTLVGGTAAALDGARRLHAGSVELSGGLQEARAGSGELTAGLQEARAGSGELTAGLATAADGSGRLSSGIGEAKDGAGQIEQGVDDVGELGVKEIIHGANETTVELARTLALMEAQDRRAAEESLTFGPPRSDQAEEVVGGSGVVLTMDALDDRAAESATRGIASGLAFLVLLGLGMLGTRALARRPG